MAARRTLVALGAAALVLTAGCTSGSDDEAAPATEAAPTTPAGPPATLDGQPHMDGAVQLLVADGAGPDTFALPDTAPYPSLVLTVTCSSGDTETELELRNAAGTGSGEMGSNGCNGASWETPPLDPAHPYTEIEVTVPARADYTVWVYGTQQTQVIG